MTPTDPMARPAAADFSSALVSHGVGSAEMAAIRAFARVVEPVDFARDFAVALARLVPDGTGQAAAEQARQEIESALRGFSFKLLSNRLCADGERTRVPGNINAGQDCASLSSSSSRSASRAA